MQFFAYISLLEGIGWFLFSIILLFKKPFSLYFGLYIIALALMAFGIKNYLDLQHRFQFQADWIYFIKTFCVATIIYTYFRYKIES